MANFKHKQSFKSGDQEIFVERKEVVTDGSWYVILLISFVIACCTLLAGAFMLGRWWERPSEYQKGILATTSRQQDVHVDLDVHTHSTNQSPSRTSVTTATYESQTCRERCEAKNSGDSLRMCLVKECDP